MAQRGGRVAVAAAAAAGLALVGLGAGHRPPVVHATGQGLFAFDRPGINAHTSPAVAADPARPGTVAVVDRIDSPQFSCAVTLSKNGGLSWRPVALPLPAGVENCWWPDAGYDDRGRLLVLYTTTGGANNLPVGVWLQAFDGDRADGAPVRVAGSEAFQAHMAVEGPNVLVAYVQATPDTAGRGLGFSAGPNPVTAVRSADGGRTFAAPVAVSEPSRRVVAPDVVLGPGGKAVLAALDLGGDTADYEATHDGRGGPPEDGTWSVVAWASGDGGATFGPAARVSGDLVIPQRIIVNLAAVPGLGRDPRTGRLYASWDAGRGDARDVFVASSDDGGATWSTPVAVARRPRTQSLPAVAVAPDGRVDVVFYDRSRDPEDRKAEVALASSWDGGRTFAVGTVSPRAFDTRLGYGAAQGIPVLSSQLAVLARPAGALAFWADTRGTNPDDNAIQVAEAVVTTSATAGRRWPLLVGGLGLIGAALWTGLRRPA